jgi:serine/threonine-protein kinase HipA
MAEFFVYDFEYGYAGKCFYTHKHRRISSVFSYAPEYFAKPGAYNIDPAFGMTEGAQYHDKTIPGAFADSAPDHWGRNLIYKRHLYESQREGIAAGELNDIDYLLGVSDITRQGSLRFKTDREGTFIHDSHDVPKLISLPKLLNSTKALESNDSSEAIKYLLDAGSASLGGARPKATVADGGTLYIAKFPHVHDEWDVISWEYVALSLANMAGIDTPDFELIDIEGSKVLLLKRFDRAFTTLWEEGRKGGLPIDQGASGVSDVPRIGYISAMTLLAADDDQHAAYSDICLHMADVSIDYKRDLRELYRRIILSVLINNTDDHLRNHGFLRSGSGWRLSPVFDINPNPYLNAARATSIYGAASREQELRTLKENCVDFMLDSLAAEAILKEVRDAVKAWQDVAAKAGIHKDEINRMRAVFETTVDA